MRAEYFLVRTQAKSGKGGGRILLGENIGGGAITLWPIRFQWVGVWLGQEIGVHTNVTTKTYRTDYEMKQILCIRGRSKIVNLLPAPTILRSLMQNTVGLFMHQSIFYKHEIYSE
jgi:hypothetical protein